MTKTPFMAWWNAYNEALTARGEPEALLGDARYMWDWGWTPDGAAEHTADLNRDARRAA
jgi:hypothetical protein